MQHASLSVGWHLVQVGAGLGPTVDWQKRIIALQWLEALVLGGAQDFDSFMDLLKGLRDALTTQLNDRCVPLLLQQPHSMPLPVLLPPDRSADQCSQRTEALRMRHTQCSHHSHCRSS
jgi:hypothetical protein